MPALRALLPLSLLLLSACTDAKDEDPAGGDTGRPHLVDLDGDGYGAESDCDDSSAAISPGADELCNGLDDDCDGLTDEAGVVDGTLYFPDADGDGFGDPSGGATACTQPEASSTDNTDCDDGNASRSPGATESCDGLDNNCDGETDEPGATGGVGAHPDADGDGYGDDSLSVTVCSFGEGYVSNADDCDDTDPEIEPAAREVCDDVDNNCDGVTDTDAVDQEIWYQDSDADGYGLTDSTLMSCDTPSGYGSSPGDCDDSDRRVYPGAIERCDDTDNDCDGEVDDSPVDADTWYYDTDSDGYGETGTELTQCDAPGDAYVTLGGDCDEDDGDVNPGVEETWYDGLDSDCDGASDYDQDGDGYVLAELEDEDEPTYDPGTGEIVDDGSATEAGDCDDTNNKVNPGGRERCNDTDDDCDGEVDDDPTDAKTYYSDADGDTYGTDESEIVTCDTLTGYVRRGGDCDDEDADVSPGESENCDEEDGIDNDCDGSTDECVTVEMSFVGYYIVGEYSSTWDCINYYEAIGESVEDTCDGCDYSLEITATYVPDALSGSYDECDWADLEYFEELDEFTSTWGIAYEPTAYPYPLVYYKYGEIWYPSAYLYYGDGYYGYGYLNWVTYIGYDSSGTLEAGLFFGYPYTY